MKFRETAMVIDQNNKICDVVIGDRALVNFPQEKMWKMHKENPGQILTMAHTHEGLEKFSQEDITTLKAWAMGFYPYPISMDVIVYDWRFQKYYIKRKTFRYVENIIENKKILKKNELILKDIPEKNLPDVLNDPFIDWLEMIVRLSYV